MSFNDERTFMFGDQNKHMWFLRGYRWSLKTSILCNFKLDLSISFCLGWTSLVILLCILYFITFISSILVSAILKIVQKASVYIYLSWKCKSNWSEAKRCCWWELYAGIISICLLYLCFVALFFILNLSSRCGNQLEAHILSGLATLK